MFEKTFSFWRRLVHRDPAAESETDTAVHDDRRLWVRFASELTAQVQVAEQPERVSAQVRDISMGGAHLLVDKPFQTGQLLTLELPARGDEMRTVLGCVVRVLPHGDKQWSVGCVFSRELSKDDLEAVGAEGADHLDDDPRVWKRFACDLQANYQIVGAGKESLHSAQILNLSASGVGLLVQEPLEAGRLLSVDLLDREGKLVRSILGCVVHTTAREGGDRAVGCNFIRQLAEDEVLALLG